MQLLYLVKGRLLFILLRRSLTVAHHFRKSCHYQWSLHCESPAHYACVSRLMWLLCSPSFCMCGIWLWHVSMGVVWPRCFITHSFPSFFIYSRCRTVFWLFLQIICTWYYLWFSFQDRKGALQDISTWRGQLIVPPLPQNRVQPPA